MKSIGFEQRVLGEMRHPEGAVPLIARVRGTLLASSVQGVRERGLTETYFEELPAEHHDAIRGLVASTWIPIEVAEAHYAAIDRLPLNAGDHWAMGRRVAERVQHGWVGTVVRGLKASGTVTPANVLARFQQGWDRLMDGGGASRVVQTGPKDIQIECYGIPLATSTYFRHAWCGMFESTLELVARKVFVRELVRYRSPTSCAFAISWA